MRILSALILTSALLIASGCSDDEGNTPYLDGGGGKDSGLCSALTCGGCCTANGACILALSKENCGSGGNPCKTCTGTQSCVNGSCTSAGCSNCAAGCCQNGLCKAGISDSACGTGGGQCAVCKSNEKCTAGICVPQSSCGPGSCAGCCNGNSCVSGTSDSACGIGGGACKTCSGGDKCQGGGCAKPNLCGPGKCNGCCSGGQCKTGNTSSACGTGGNACKACKSGESCQSGVCKTSTQPCGPTNCNGCCQAGACVSGTSSSACGVGGATCSACKSGETCSGGKCGGSSTCGPGSCSGCCKSGMCLSGTSASDCGTGGASCTACSTYQKCVTGACKLDSTSTWDIVAYSAKVSQTTKSSWDTWPANGAPDAFIEMTAGTKTGTTQVKANTWAPVWNEAVIKGITAGDITTYGVSIEVKDDDPIGSETMGSCKVSISESVLVSLSGVVNSCADSKGIKHVTDIVLKFNKK